MANQASLFSCHTLCRPAPCCKMFNCRNHRKRNKTCPTEENTLYILISFHRWERDSSGDAETSGTSIHNPWMRPPSWQRWFWGGKKIPAFSICTTTSHLWTRFKKQLKIFKRSKSHGNRIKAESHFVHKCSSAGKTLDVLLSKQNEQIRNCQEGLKQKQI